MAERCRRSRRRAQRSRHHALGALAPRPVTPRAPHAAAPLERRHSASAAAPSTAAYGTFLRKSAYDTMLTGNDAVKLIEAHDSKKTVTVDAEIDEDTSGVLYALGGVSGGLTLYMEMGELVCEYNMMIVDRYTARSTIRRAPAQARWTPTLVGRVAGRGGSGRGRQGGRSRHRQAHCASRLYRQREP